MTFIRTLIARMKAEHSVSDKRVYVFGYSNGGHMAFRLAIEAPDEIAAVAAVAASLPTSDASSCPQQGRTSRVMLINGTADPINPYQGQAHCAQPNSAPMLWKTSRGPDSQSRIA